MSAFHDPTVKVRVPRETASVAVVKPLNSKTCCAANAETSILWLNSVSGSVVVFVTAILVLVEESVIPFSPDKADIDVLNALNSVFRRPIEEIATSASSIFS